MRKILILWIVLALSTSANAQLFMLGLKGGVSSSTIQIDKAFDLDQGGKINFQTGDAVLGWHAGLFSRISLGGLYIQPEALLTNTGGEIIISEDGSVAMPDIANISLFKLDVPVMLGYKFGDTFRLYAGPAYSMIIKEKTTSESSFAEQLKHSYSKGTLGYQAGLGFDISKLLIDLKYENNLSALGESVTDPITGTTFNTDSRNAQLILSLGFRF
ncbi:porin family protein [Bacteroidota bacterium]